MALKKSGIELVAAGWGEYFKTLSDVMKTNDALTESFVKVASTSSKAISDVAKAITAEAEATKAHYKHLDILAKSRIDKLKRQWEEEDAIRKAAADKRAADRKREADAEALADRSSLGTQAGAAISGKYSNMGGVVAGVTAIAAGSITGIGAVVAGIAIAFTVLSKAASAAGDTIKKVASTMSGAAKFVVNLTGDVLKLAASIAGALVKAFLTIVSTAGQVVAAVGKIGSSFLSWATSPIRSGLQWISDTLGKILPTLTAFLMRDIIGGLANKFKDFSREVITAISAFQKLNIQFESLVARDIAHTLGVPISEALGMVETKAYGLLKWIKQFAVATMFTAEDIAKTMAMANAYGLNAMEAQKLTMAVADFTSAMGLSGDEMFRIVYNFGQMYSMGKLTGREFRDLANTFVPVYDILGRMAEKAGIARDAFIELAMTGGVPVKEFFDEFIAYAEEAFPNAAERMAYTWDAVKSNIGDFFKILVGTNILGPVFDEITRSLAELLMTLMNPEIQTATEKLGLAVKYSFDQILVAIDTVSQAVSVFYRTIKPAIEAIFNIKIPKIPGLDSLLKGVIAIGIAIRDGATLIKNWLTLELPSHLTNAMYWIRDVFFKMSDKAFDWGIGFVTQFAQGLISGAVGALTAAINFISSLLTSWFSLHSPPRILPLIDKWGIQTAALWMKGWEDIDYSALDSIQGVLSGALQGLFNIGVIQDEKMIDKLFVNLSKDMIEAIKNFNATGEMSAEMFAKLRALGGGFGSELANLLDLQVQMVRAVDAQAAAERRLIAAQKARATAEYNLNKQISAYNAALRGGAGRGEMRNRLALVNADEIALDLARKEETAAEAAKKAADEQVAAVKELVSLQEKLIQNLIELAKAQRETLGGGGGGDVNQFGTGGFGAGFPPNVELPNIDDIIAEMEKAMEGFWPTLTSVFSTALQNAWNTFVPDTTALSTAFENIKNLDWNKIGTDVAGAFKRIGDVFRSIDWEKLGQIFKSIWTAISNIFKNIDWERIGKAIGDTFKKVSDFLVTTDWNKVITDIQTAGTNIGQFLTDVVNAFQGIQGSNENINKLIKLGQDLATAWEAVRNAVRDVQGAFKEGFNLQPSLLNIGNMGKPEDSDVVKFFKALATVLGTEVGKTKTYLDTYGEAFKTFFAIFTSEDAKAFRDFILGWQDPLLGWGLVYFMFVGLELTFWSIADAVGKIVTWFNKFYIAFQIVKDMLSQPLNTSAGIGKIIGDLSLLVGLFWPSEESTNPENSLPAKVNKSLVEYTPKIITNLGTLATDITTKWTEIRTTAETKWQAVLAAINTQLILIGAAVHTKLQEVYEYFAGSEGKPGKIQEIINYLLSPDLFTKFSTAGANIVAGLIAGIGSMWNALMTYVTALAIAVIGAVNKVFDQRSPSKVFTDIGADLPESMATGIKSKGSMPMQAAEMMAAGTVMAAQQRVSAPSVYRTSNVQFGDVNINNGMDMATFRQAVLKVVAEGS